MKISGVNRKGNCHKKTQNANLLFQAANYYYSTNRDVNKAIEWLNEAEK
jgi:hypothetical protein